MKQPWTRGGQLTSIARASRVKAFGSEAAVAKREADLATLTQVTARLKPQPQPQPPQYDPFGLSAAAKKAWAQAIQAQLDKAVYDFISAPPRAGKSTLAGDTLTLDKLKRAAATMDRNNRPSGMVLDDIVEFVGPPTKEQVLAQVTARLKPPPIAFASPDGHFDALRYSFGIDFARPAAVVMTSCV